MSENRIAFGLFVIGMGVTIFAGLLIVAIIIRDLL